MNLLIFLAFVLGLIVGSFLNVVILRWPKGQSLQGRSHCAHCGHSLSPRDLVPVLSYIFLNGKCRFCGEKISPRYFYVEAATGILFAACAAYFTPFDFQSVLVFFRAAFIVSVLIVVFMTDLEHFLILDKVVLHGAAVLLIFNLAIDLVQKNPFFPSLALIGALSSAGLFAFFGALYYFSNGKWIGFGDAKFALFLGLATPFPFILANVFLAYALGAVAGIFLILFAGKKLVSRIPFGVFLSASTLIALFYGAALVSGYARAVGIYGLRY